MAHILQRRLALATALGFALSPALAATALTAGTDRTPTKKAKTTKTAKITKTKASARAKSFSGDQGESPAERGRRLQVECRGLPNAGACRGYGWGS